MKHVRGAPHLPQTQGKIERWHQTLKNRILHESHYLPGDLERAIADFVELSRSIASKTLATDINRNVARTGGIT